MKSEPKEKSADLRANTALNQMQALLYETLETEKGKMLIYDTALRCAINDDLAREWKEYRSQTVNHVSVLTTVLKQLGLNPDQETPGRSVVRFTGLSLVRTMEIAIVAGKPLAAQMVAVECVVLAEIKDHMNWELIGNLADTLTGPEQQTLKKAYDEVENEEDEHLYHSTGWARELHLQALGLPAQLPPAEEQQDVRDEMEAAELKKQRKETLANQKGARSEKENREKSAGIQRSGAHKQKRQNGRSAA